MSDQKEPRVIHIAITKHKQISNAYDFTYLPSTVHVLTGDRLMFELEDRSFELAFLLFDTALSDGAFQLAVGSKASPEEKTTSFPQRGVHHYRFVGIRGGELIADAYCPSVIVH
jgi:plastocyanin